MQAIEIDFSPGSPCFIVITRRRLMPTGTWLPSLQAMTHPLQSMQRSVSHKNLIRAMLNPPQSPVMRG
jgi:hypothetical protein